MEVLKVVDTPDSTSFIFDEGVTGHVEGLLADPLVKVEENPDGGQTTTTIPVVTIDLNNHERFTLSGRVNALALEGVGVIWQR